MQENSIKQYLNTLPVFWAVLTAVYTSLTFPLIDGKMEWLGSIYGIIGLFVPIGLFNFLLSFDENKWFITFPLVLLGVFGGEYILRRMSISVFQKACLALALLFILTIAVDLIIYGEWMSLQFIWDSGEAII